MDLFTNYLSNIVFSILFLLFFLYIGKILLICFKLSDNNIGLQVACGFLLNIFYILYFISYKWNIFILIITIFAFLFYLFNKNINIKSIFDRIDFYIISSTVIIISTLFFFISRGSNIALLGNSDLFNWYAAASHLSGVGNYFNIAPDASEVFNTRQYNIDGYATSWFLNIVALRFIDKPILSSGTAIIILSSWMALSINYKLNLFLKLKVSTSIYLSSLVVASPFYVYIAFNGFFAHLLGLISSILLITAALETSIDKKFKFINSYIAFLVPSLLMLMAYQSGFFVFQGICFLLILLLSIKFTSIPQLIRGNIDFSARIISPYILSILTSIVILYDFIKYTINRTLNVSNQVAGWPLPLEVPQYMLKFFPILSGNNALLLYLLLSIIFILLIIYLNNSINIIDIKNELSKSIILFSILILIYFIWYYTGSSPYQNWKYASFFIYSMSYVFIIPIFLGIFNIRFELNKKIFYFKYILTIFILILYSSWNISYLQNYYKRMISYDQYAHELFDIKSYLPIGMPLVLDLAPFPRTMLAMDILSLNNELFPLAASYLKPATMQQIDSLKTPLLLKEKAECISISPEKVIYQTPHFLLAHYSSAIPLETKFPASFNFSAKCFPDWLKVVKGLSGPEPHGRWSDGNIVLFRVFLSKGDLSNSYQLEFNVSPYMPKGGIAQSGNIYLNNILMNKFSLDKKDKITVNVPSKFIGSNIVEVKFEMLTPLSPSSFGGSDPRMLGLTFESVKISKN